MNMNISILQQLNYLKRTFQGDPRQHVQQMLNNGQISQTQYDNAVKQAQQIMNMLYPGGRG